ncbi:acyl-CoA thioester hydrolase/BAAT C-terminal domain-containing protein [Halorientalis brevis]|uniref:Acyl-CoA thioester hydrolase/BAAT C-terminal domain-containing protein n=1 Tax=Halorientalis brevis TaxID=1126241 RepID=A0ABD6CBL5_9EURY|nr:acyl-CoA thioester hydrolase/BAAT C-terminal domain-containing protein [Halorientalis brevis]
MARPSRLVVDPTTPLVDERFTVRLAGFPPNRRVTVRARMPLDGAVWESRAVVRTDDEGRTDLDEQTPLDGTYDRADAMGLVWAARRTGDRPTAANRTKTDGNVSITAALEGTVVATATVERRFAADGVTSESVADPELVAELYQPPGDGPHPGVLLLGGSSGGFPSRRAASLLASRGFAVLALAYFGVSSRPRNLLGLPLEYVDRAVDWLVADERVRDLPLGVVGWSRGGELALLTGARRDPVQTVVAYVPSTVVFQGNALTGDPGSAWTVNGEGHPYVPLEQPPGFRTRAALRWLRGRPLSVRPLFERGLDAAPAARLAAATIPIEETGGPILLVTGDDDRVWPADRLATRAMARLDAHEYPHDYTHLQLPGAGHDVKVPFHPTSERATRPMRFPGRSLGLDMGGTPAGYASADEQAWNAMLETLRTGLDAAQ